VAEDALVLQKMTWPEVKAYLEESDMVIVTLGSTEQHGPHLPLGTDGFEALDISKRISERTGVVVAQALMVGRSDHHTGFPGTLSLTPETMEQALYEVVDSLIGHGFRRILFFNYHGGNNIVQNKLVYRINNGTEAVAVAVGHGGPIQAAGEDEDDGLMDWHAGKSETSIMLHLRPEMVRWDLVEKPAITFTPRMLELKQLAEKEPSLVHVWDSLFGVPAETGKGGASHQLSSNGIWTLADPTEATADLGCETVEAVVERASRFILAWQQETKLVGGAKPR
jgi:creatinine amidohydrolase/Fe(II)-dependent formamide hydrolase-like protein